MRCPVARYRNRLVAELARQFSFTPRKKRLEQLERLRRFAPRIDPDRSYPYEFVLYQIVGFRFDVEEQAVFDGRSLRADLMRLLHDLSDTLDLPVSYAGEPVLTLPELARAYDVSLKTLRRWRSRGLVALRFVFPDGRKRTAVPQSDLEAFVEANPKLVGQHSVYSRLDETLRRQLLARAFQLSLRHELTEREAVARLAREFGCSHGAVRKVLDDYQRAHPQTPIFPDGRDPLSEAERRQLLAYFRHGYKPGELARSFLVGRTTIERTLRELVAEEILGRKWEYIPCEDFEAPDAEERLIRDLSPEALEEKGLAGPLDAQQEERLFRQYNFLKSLLARAREELRPSDLSPEQLERLCRVHEMALAVRNCLILANLRLVVHLASRHLGTGRRLDELVSDGTVSLMQAIEKFDFRRGNRFSTYATWAILRNFAKTIPHEARIHHTEITGTTDLIASHGDPKARVPQQRDFRDVLRSTVAELLLELSPREREIIAARFGIGRQAETLEQIGQRFGVSRERIRQLEARALRKLSEIADPQLVEELVAPRE